MPQPADPAPEIWRGGVNTWECDEMGHMNVRFYVVRAVEGLAGMAAALGLPRAFAPDAASTLIVREQHIRFLREAHAGAPLHMTGGVLEFGESDARLLLVLWHSEREEPAASFQVVVEHAEPASGTPLPWPAEVRARAEALTVACPPFAAARSVALDPVTPTASLQRAEQLDLVRIGLGAIQPQDCDVFGRMRAEQFIGRVSDGVPRLVGRNRRLIAERSAEPPARTGGAVLEYRLLHLAWPRAGDRIELRSGLAGVDSRVQRLVHWLLDPDTGRAWGAAEAVAIAFDLDTRKAVPISEAAQAVMRSLVAEGLSL